MVNVTTVNMSLTTGSLAPTTKETFLHVDSIEQSICQL